MSAVRKPKRIGDLLIEKGVLTSDQLSIALTEQKKSSAPLGKIIVQLGFVTEAVVRDALGEALGQESIDLSKVVLDSEVLQLVGKDIARRYRILPLSVDRQRGTLTVAMSDTFNSAHELWAGRNIPVEAIAELDRKVDDGVPGTGDFQNGQSGNANPGTCVAGGVWAVTAANPEGNCGGVYRL